MWRSRKVLRHQNGSDGAPPPRELCTKIILSVKPEIILGCKLAGRLVKELIGVH